MLEDNQQRQLTSGATLSANAAPLVSVVMAVFNGESHLRAALESVLAQTFRDFELVVVNDGSTDGTARILADYAVHDRRIRVLTNAENMGLARTRNRSLDAALAPLMAVADADDVFRPDRLERQVSYMRCHREVGFAGSNAVLIDSYGEELSGGRNLPLEDREIRFALLLGGCFWNTSTIYRTELVRQVGGYRFDSAEDYDLWSRLLEVTKAANQPERLVFVRMHADSLTADLSRILRRQSAVAQKLLAAYLERAVGEEEALGALTLFMYGWRLPVPRSSIPLALGLLSEVAVRAEVAEPPRVASAFRKRVARSLSQQASFQRSIDRLQSVRLAWQAVHWDSAIVATTEFALLTAAVAMPDTVLRGLRYVKRRLLEAR